jgi:hypothetical protein
MSDIHRRKTEVLKERDGAKRRLSQAQWELAEDRTNEAKERAVQDRRRELQLLDDQIEGFAEGLRIEAHTRAEQQIAADRKKLKAACRAAIRKIDERLEVQREIAGALKTIGANGHLSEALAFDALKLVRPHMLQHDFLELKDSALLPNFVSEPEMIVNRIAADGFPVPGLSQVEAATYAGLHKYDARIEARAKRAKDTLEQLIADADD